MTNKTRYLSSKEILNTILNDVKYFYDYTFIIFGKTRPTGNTWLCKKLKSNKLKAIEVSKQINDLINYKDKNNHLIIDFANKTVIIILNKLIKRR